MLVLFDRKIKIQTGVKSQTVNICTRENILGKYEYRVRLHPPFFVEPNSLVEKRFGNIQEIVTYLQEQHNGTMEISPLDSFPPDKHHIGNRPKAGKPEIAKTLNHQTNTLANWNGRDMAVVRSRGGVLAAANPYDNLVSSGISPWPPAEIVQKLYQSRQLRAFDEQSAATLSERLGYYTDLQSINSEDAITWSVLGTIIYASDPDKLQWTKDFIKLLNINAPKVKSANIWLWRHIPHPDTLIQNGPEIDFGVQTDDTIVLGEAKWKSGVGKKQGKKKDKDQLILRIEFLQKYGERLYPNVKNRIVLLVSPSGDSEPSFRDKPSRHKIQCIEKSWDDLCGIASHPIAGELQRYLAWKKVHSQIA